MNSAAPLQTVAAKPLQTAGANLLLQRKCACGAGASNLTGECAECGKKKMGVQTKLRINKLGDQYEQEADRVVDQVLATPGCPAVSSASPRIQRFTGQPGAWAGRTAPASVDQALASPGRPLDAALRQGMEQRFGHDFSRVRVHTGTAAERSAQDVDADAYTAGHDIVVGPDRLAAGGHEGRRLIAHELTHVMQQSGKDGMSVGQTNDGRGLSPVSPRAYHGAAVAGGGCQIAQPLRRSLETRFGADFSRVRLHDDVNSHRAALALRASAFTLGQHVHFGPRQFDVASRSGYRLLVHELAHTIQQRTDSHEQLGVISDREYEAERAVTQVVDGGPVPHLHTYGVAVACQPSGSANDAAIEGEIQVLRLQLQMPVLPTGRGPILARLHELEKRRGPASRVAPTLAKKPPAWMSPTFKGALPGVPVPGYESPRKVYTPEDAAAMMTALVARNEDNAANVAYFLEQYVSAAVEICGLFVSSEMSKAAKAAGLGIFGKLLKFALEEILIAIATGGSGVFVRGLEKLAAKALKLLASRGAGFAIVYESDVIEKDLSTPDLDKKQKKLDEITKALSTQVGTVTYTMVSQLGEGDTTYLGIWLGQASKSPALRELQRFRIPELFPRANRKAIRAVIAGAIAGRAHDHYRAQGMMQESYRLGPGERLVPSEVHHMDDNVIIAHMTPKAGGANVRDIQFYSTSRVLSKELIGNASVQSMPTVPLFIVVDATEADDAAAAKTLMKAIRFPGEPDQFDLSQFLSSVARTERQMQMLVKRNPQGLVTVAGGGLAEQVWLYVWATVDADLTQVASQLLEWQQGEEAHSAQMEATQGVEGPPESHLASAAGLGMKAREILPNFAVPGAKRFIAGYVVSLVPQTPESRFDDAYWRKDNRGLFWKTLPHTGWSK